MIGGYYILLLQCGDDRSMSEVCEVVYVEWVIIVSTMALNRGFYGTNVGCYVQLVIRYRGLYSMCYMMQMIRLMIE